MTRKVDCPVCSEPNEYEDEEQFLCWVCNELLIPGVNASESEEDEEEESE